MKSIKLFCCLVILLMLNFSFGQVDREKKSIRIPAELSKKKKDSTPNKIKVEPKNKPSLTNIDKSKVNGLSVESKKFVIKKSEKPFSMFENDGLKDPGQIFEERWKKQAAEIGLIQVMSDQFLGEHRIDSKFVNIVCRDHEYPDGDRVQIILNDSIVHQNILLTGSYRRVQIDLVNGLNKIDILALNQGESGPNTAEFVVYDDKGNLVSSKEWNLLTGVKATIIFRNEKAVIVRDSDAEN